MRNCADCKYLRKLKHNFELYKGYSDSFCCVMWEYDYESNEEGYNKAWIQQVSLDSTCECFSDGVNCYNKGNENG